MYYNTLFTESLKKTKTKNPVIIDMVHAPGEVDATNPAFFHPFLFISYRAISYTTPHYFKGVRRFLPPM